MTAQKRPLSPHLQIYRPQLTSLLSFAHRLTGIASAAGLGLLLWWIAALARGPESFAAFQSVAGSLIGRLMLLGWTWALFYHLANGIRHLAWDAGWGYSLPAAYRSGWLVLAASVALTLLAWIAILGALR